MKVFVTGTLGNENKPTFKKKSFYHFLFFHTIYKDMMFVVSVCKICLTWMVHDRKLFFNNKLTAHSQLNDIYILYIIKYISALHLIVFPSSRISKLAMACQNEHASGKKIADRGKSWTRFFSVTTDTVAQLPPQSKKYKYFF